MIDVHRMHCIKHHQSWSACIMLKGLSFPHHAFIRLYTSIFSLQFTSMVVKGLIYALANALFISFTCILGKAYILARENVKSFLFSLHNREIIVFWTSIEILWWPADFQDCGSILVLWENKSWLQICSSKLAIMYHICQLKLFINPLCYTFANLEEHVGNQQVFF